MQLTQCQEKARTQFFEFLASDETCMVLDGYAGVGKTTLVKQLIEEMEKQDQLKRAIDPDHRNTEFALTATTNKAAESLEHATGLETGTIHSFLGIGVRTDYSTGEQFLTRKRDFEKPEGVIIFIDECSYIDDQLLRMINTGIGPYCKLVYMGDPTQLTPVGSSTTPVFNQGYRTAKLVQVVRQAADNPIQELTKGLREHILGADFPQCKPDGQYIIHVPRHEFDDMVLQEFTREDWKAKDSRLLAWTNKTVIKYNQALHNKANGRREFAIGDQAINNHYVGGKDGKLKTDQLVTIQRIGEPEERNGVLGRMVMVAGSMVIYFMPDKPSDIERTRMKFIAAGESGKAKAIEENWVDFRPAYACTVNKSQGSTYDTAFIDLSDIGRCRERDQVARMLYVAISRARQKVILTGDVA